MHPTFFQLRAFGQMWLPAAPARDVVRHLRAGCGRCRASLSPYLIPWMDDGPAAEAITLHPGKAGPALCGAYLEAAGRAARAAVKARRPGSRGVRQVLERLEREGTRALRHLPRSLLGAPAIDALLLATTTLGAEDPYLRAQLAEIACDMAALIGARAPRNAALRRTRCRAALEAAAAWRQLGALNQAQERLDQTAELLAHGPRDTWTEASLHAGRGALELYQNRFGAAARSIDEARRLFRQGGHAQELARAFAYLGWLSADTGDVDRTLEANGHALHLTESHPNLSIRCAAIHNNRIALLANDRWREALALTPPPHPSPLCRAKYACLEGMLLNLAGDATAAERAFDSSYRLYSRLGRSYSAAIVLLHQAAALEDRGRHEPARQLVLTATTQLLTLSPGREVYAALLLLRTSRRLTTARSLLPLPPLIAFLREAEFDPSLRCDSTYRSA